MSIVKIGWSGGKDSTCAVMKHIERGDKVKAVCYIPMFTKDIPLITKKHYEFILKTAEYFRSLGAEVNILYGITYWEHVTHISTRGKYKGKMFGFPYIMTGKCGFNRDSKSKVCQNFDVGDFDYTSLGIAYDEKKRHNQLNDKKRSILVEEQITEQEAFDFCKERGLLSPIYENPLIKRDGCALCPHAQKSERDLWFADYPEAVPLVIELQNIVKRERPDRPPLRGMKYFIE